MINEAPNLSVNEGANLLAAIGQPVASSVDSSNLRTSTLDEAFASSDDEPNPDNPLTIAINEL